MTESEARFPLARNAHIGYVSGVYSSIDEQGFHVSHGIGRILSQLSNGCGRLTLAFSGAPANTSMLDHCIPLTSGNVSALPLPYIPNIARGMLLDRPCRKVIRELERQCDAIIVHMPFSPPSALLPARSKRLYHVCGDCVEVVRASPYYRGPKRIAALAAAHALDRLHMHLFRDRKARVITNGETLYRHYRCPPGKPVVSCSLLAREVNCVTRQRGKGEPFRILFVGYLRPEKGLETLLDSFLLVRRNIPDCELHIIGSQDLSEGGAAADLKKRVQQLRNDGMIHQHGHIPFGKTLFQHYADADVLILPSKSEGTPRVLLEARAFGCPVIATNVGGIPTSVKDRVNGLLVPPENPEAITNAVLEIARDDTLRRKLIDEGLAYSKERPLEAYVNDILSEVEILLAADHQQ